MHVDAKKANKELDEEFENPEIFEYKETYTNAVDPITGVHHLDEASRLLLDEKLLEATNLVRLNDEMQHVKEMFRTKLINMYTKSDFSDEQVAEVINEYTELRFKDLMLNPKFVDSV
jgi:Mg2+/Co2+ transporter CorB